MTKYFKNSNNKQRNLQILDFLFMKIVQSEIENKKFTEEIKFSFN